MNTIQFLTMVGCHNCAAAKEIFDEVLPDYKDKVSVEEIDITSPQGQELISKHSIFASPGIIINDELFSTGGVDKDKLVEKLQTLT
tara:strand:- start:1419 stop:1676 length:258 start_codon:yes stop_codon:yes gene_type:complete